MYTYCYGFFYRKSFDLRAVRRFLWTHYRRTANSLGIETVFSISGAAVTACVCACGRHAKTAMTCRRDASGENNERRKMKSQRTRQTEFE